jgi:hypothetical protein
MAEEINPVVSKLFDLANTWSVPLQSRLSKSPKSKAVKQHADKAVVMQSATHARLNGSGPSDPTLAVATAPTTIQGFIAGSGPPGGKSIGTPPPETSADTNFFNRNAQAIWLGVIVVGVGVIAWIVLRKR